MTTRKAKVRFNYSDYCLLPEDKRYELIDGELYMAPAPSSRHQRCLFRLARLLADFVDQQGTGEIFIAPFDVIMSDEDVAQPDVFFVSRDRRGIISARGCEGAPDLVVEILSPSNMRRDTELKRKQYAKYGVREYWLVDPGAETIEIMNLGAEDFVSQGIYTQASHVTSQVISQISIPVNQVFQLP